MRMIRTELDGEKVQLACAHWRSFPPSSALGSKAAAELWQKQKISEAEFQRHQIWEKICGLLEMDPKKCLQCPHVRIAKFQKHLPVLVTLDGKTATPTIDLPSLECSSRHRDFLDAIQPPPGHRK